MTIFVSQAGFSHRTQRLLTQCGITTLEDLARQSEAKLLSVRGFGEMCLNEVKLKLRDNGLDLGMARPDAAPADFPVDTGAENTSVEHPVQMESAPRKEECGACHYSRSSENPAEVECHRGSPQVFFRQFGSGAVQHTGYWPTVPARQWCGEFKVREQ